MLYFAEFFFYSHSIMLIAICIGSDNPGECMHQQNMSDMAGSPDGLDLDENSDWLHTNDSYIRGTRHEGTASTPTGKQRVMLHLLDKRWVDTNYCYKLLSQDCAADRDFVAVLTNVDSQDVPG